jgi:hypothetical protein
MGNSIGLIDKQDETPTNHEKIYLPLTSFSVFAYENLGIDSIIPIGKILKTNLLSTSRLTLPNL